MKPGDLADRVLIRLRSGGIQVYDGAPAETPKTGRYLIFYGTGGLARQDRLEGGSQTYLWPCRVVCVGRTKPGLRAAVADVRALLTDWRPDPDPAASPMWEEVAGPELTDGPPDDERHSVTLEYRLTTRR